MDKELEKFNKEQKIYQKNIKTLEDEGFSVSLVPKHLLHNHNYELGICELYVPGEGLKRFNETTKAWQHAIKKYLKT